MKNINIELTDEQIKFLKLFAENHYAGAKDNLYTNYPIHIVQNKRYEYIPYSVEIRLHYEGFPLVFSIDDDRHYWYENEIEAVKAWYEDECPIPIKSFEDLYWEEIKDIDGNLVTIISYEDYFRAYGIDNATVAWRTYYWENVAFFFIRKEAIRYMEYQRHNLIEPRVYTFSSGYSNFGDFEHFWDLLMSIGEKLIKENELIDERKKEKIEGEK